MNPAQIFDLAVTTLAEYDLLAKGWKVAWDNGKRRAGACHYATRTISLSRHILPGASDEEIRETILHEVAHALTPGHSHDGVWRAKLIEMGGTGARTHQMEVPQGRYEVICEECGVVGHRHAAQGTWRHTVNRPHGFAYYVHRKCGKGRMWLRDTKSTAPIHNPTVDGPVTVHTILANMPTAASTPKPAKSSFTCTCGCGGMTKGGRYLPGHDARHVSEVFEGWIKNQYDLPGGQDLLPTEALKQKLARRVEVYVAKQYKD